MASAIARRVELWDDNIVIQTLAARAAVLAFGDELCGPQAALRCRFAAALAARSRHGGCPHLLPRAEAALRQELQRLADAAKRAREGQSSSGSPYDSPRACWPNRATLSTRVRPSHPFIPSLHILQAQPSTGPA
jgi:hypothetical protein